MFLLKFTGVFYTLNGSLLQAWYRNFMHWKTSVHWVMQIFQTLAHFVTGQQKKKITLIITPNLIRKKTLSVEKPSSSQIQFFQLEFSLESSDLTVTTMLPVVFFEVTDSLHPFLRKHLPYTPKRSEKPKCEKNLCHSSKQKRYSMKKVATSAHNSVTHVLSPKTASVLCISVHSTSALCLLPFTSQI